MQIYLRHGEQYGGKAEQAQAQTRAERLRCFWLMLGETMKGHEIPRPSDRPFTIFNLACGVCEEARPLNAFFATGIAGFPSNAVEMFGVDREPGNVQAALVSCDAFDPFFYHPYFHLGLRAFFVCGDATQLDMFPQTPAIADFAIMRHQFAVRSPAEVKIIVTKALARLAPEGKFLFTSFTESEHVALLAMLASLPVEVLLERENPHALAVKGDYIDEGVAIDKFVCLVKAKSA